MSSFNKNKGPLIFQSVLLAVVLRCLFLDSMELTVINCVGSCSEKKLANVSNEIRLIRIQYNKKW